MDAEARDLSYKITPPDGTTGTHTISGTISIDGSLETTGGDTTLGPCPAHPADTNKDWQMVITEVTAYGYAWKKGEDWISEPISLTIPNSLPLQANLFPPN